MFKNKPIIMLFGVIFFSVMLGIAYFWDTEKEGQRSDGVRIIKSKEPSDGAGENAEIVIKDLILKEIEKHKGLEVVVNAREGKILNSTDKIECKNINCALNDNGKQIADLKADSAVIHKQTKNVFLVGPTLGHVNEMEIVGQDISYNYSNHMLTTSKKINYQHKCFSMSANKSSVDLKNSKITMNGGVESAILNRPAGYGHGN